MSERLSNKILNALKGTSLSAPQLAEKFGIESNPPSKEYEKMCDALDELRTYSKGGRVLDVAIDRNDPSIKEERAVGRDTYRYFITGEAEELEINEILSPETKRPTVQPDDVKDLGLKTKRARRYFKKVGKYF